MNRYGPLPPPRPNIADPTQSYGAYRQRHPAPPPRRRRSLSGAGAPLLYVAVAAVGLPMLGVVLIAAAALGPLVLLGVLAGLSGVGLVGVLRATGVIAPRRRRVGRRR